MNKIITLILIAVTALSAASCQTTQNPDPVQAVDREGNPITLPVRLDRIISMGPSNTEILTELGFADRIIAADTYSKGIPGLTKDVLFFDMLASDGEQIIQLEPDMIFVTGMSKAGGANPFKMFSDMGICVLHIPTSSSIADIKTDISYIATVMGTVEKGEKIVAGMENEIEKIKAIGKTITNRKTVYFEIASSPYLYSFGKGVFLNEMIEIIGAENILADKESWVAVADEVILKKNPDVILTNGTDSLSVRSTGPAYNSALDESVQTIMSRSGWDKMTAVQNRDVYYIDADASSRPSHNIVKALQEMAKVVYPGKY